MSDNNLYAKAIIIDSLDNVATAVADINQGEEIRLSVAGENITLKIAAFIPDGHKVSLRHISKGEAVLKYGQSIGSALMDIAPGVHVHVHNMESNRGRGDLKYEKEEKSCR
jgi:altronate dehydratase small subunit